VGGEKTKKLFILDFFLEKGEKKFFFYCFLKKKKK
jgi:hypothetical protein